MPLSLIHLLAARACHADTLKRALLHNPEACRLLAYFGVTPTHLEDIAKGNTSRLRAATSTTLADYLLLYAHLHTVDLESPKADAIRDRMDAPWRALTPKEHEAVRVVGALYDRLAKVQAERGDIRAQADFEYRLAEADEHVRVTEKRLLHAAEFENEVLTLLDVEYRSEALDAIRALQGRLAAQAEPKPPAAHERDGMKPEHRLARIRLLLCFSDETLEHDLAQMCLNYGKLRARLASLEDARSALEDLLGESASLLGIDDEDREGVPDAIRCLLNRAESAEAASEHGPIADLTLLTGRPVRVWRNTVIPEDWLFGVAIDGYSNEHGATPHEALSRMLATVRQRETDKAKATLSTKPLAPVVLGPWRTLVQGGAMSLRSVVGGTTDGVRVSADGWAVYDRAGSCVCHGEETGQAGRDAADKWARGNGYVLIGAEPGSITGTIRGVMVPHHRHGRLVFRWEATGSAKVGLTEQGWWIHAAPDGLPNSHRRSVAEGPQTGEEGKRCALAAAHALGLTGGGE